MKDDMISRQAAIETVRSAKSIGQAHRMLVQLPPAQPGWIPTKKKPDPDLPEDEVSGCFLVTLHTYGNIGFDMDEYEVKKMRWDRVNGWVLPFHSPKWINEALTQNVLAWMPCPEAYSEREQ